MDRKRRSSGVVRLFFLYWSAFSFCDFFFVFFFFLIVVEGVLHPAVTVSVVAAAAAMAAMTMTTVLDRSIVCVFMYERLWKRGFCRFSSRLHSRSPFVLLCPFREKCQNGHLLFIVIYSLTFMGFWCCCGCRRRRRRRRRYRRYATTHRR